MPSPVKKEFSQNAASARRDNPGCPRARMFQIHGCQGALSEEKKSKLWKEKNNPGRQRQLIMTKVGREFFINNQ